MANIGYLQVTRQCNQRCRFCSNPENENLLGWEDAEAFIQELVDQGYTGVILTGGEPTLYEQLPELIAHCHAAGIEPRIISNGQRLGDTPYVDELIAAGLSHVHLSLHSCRPSVQDQLTRTPGSFDNLRAALAVFAKREITVDINTVINSYNADHLHSTVRWIVERYGYVRHFVWNNLDPHMNRVKAHPEVIPSFPSFEIALFRALSYLREHGRTFRVERVPLCYLAEFAECSTETRKIVKAEKREVHFLDERRRFVQESFRYEKGRACRDCTLNGLCAGVYCGDDYYSLDETYPLFLDPDEVIAKVGGAPSSEAVC